MPDARVKRCRKVSCWVLQVVADQQVTDAGVIAGGRQRSVATLPCDLLKAAERRTLHPLQSQATMRNV